jgi:hypothetical protein
MSISSTSIAALKSFTVQRPRLYENLTVSAFDNIHPIDIESLKNRLLKVCYVPATSASRPWILFLLRPLTVLMKQTRWPVCAIKQSIYLDVYDSPSLSQLRHVILNLSMLWWDRVTPLGAYSQYIIFFVT